MYSKAKITASWICIAAILFAISAGAAVDPTIPFLVVTSAETRLDSITPEQIRNLYLGRLKTVTVDSGRISPLDLEPNHPVRNSFYSLLFKRKQRKLEAYWARMVFTGKAFPPRVMTNQNAMVDFLIKHPGYIGYISPDKYDSRLKILYGLPDTARKKDAAPNPTEDLNPGSPEQLTK